MTKWTIKELEELKNDFEGLDYPDIVDDVAHTLGNISEEMAEKWSNEKFNEITPDEAEEITQTIFSACYSTADLLREAEAEHVAEGADDYAKESREWREELEEFAENWDE